MPARKFVRRPFERLKLDVDNQSSRHGADIKAIVVHTTESHDRPGMSDLQAIGAWFDNPASQASSHVIIDSEGMSAQCVPDDRKAWTCAGYNSVTLNIELIGWAVTPRWRWVKRRRQIRKCAQYIAWWSCKHSIPIRKGAVANGSIVRTGVLRHMDLGQAGGGHHDPGAGFPFARVLEMARYFAREGWPTA